MGSVTSRPKAPSAQQQQNISYTPTPVPQEPVAQIEPSPEEISKSRIENILRRSRSTLGNVFTSFRGVLSSNNSTPQRKSLLGE